MNNRTQAVRIGCCVGGSSAINGMVAVRGTRSEYDGWAELGGEGSTWDWEGVIPYFRKVRLEPRGKRPRGDESLVLTR